MLTAPAGILWFVGITLLLPGVGLLLLARLGFTPVSRVSAPGLRSIAQKLGLTFVLLTCALALYLLPVLLDGPRSGGLGSMGDPLGAFLMLGYIFVLAPLALIASTTVAVLYAVRRQQAQRSN
jgi:hypothetical protein